MLDGFFGLLMPSFTLNINGKIYIEAALGMQIL